MASTPCTVIDGSDDRNTEAVKTLVDLYERERVMYTEVRELSRKQLEAVKAGKSLVVIREFLTRKRNMLDMIRHMEVHHEPSKRHWEEHRHQLNGVWPARLQDGLRTLSDIIEEILELENEADRLFVGLAEA